MKLYKFFIAIFTLLGVSGCQLKEDLWGTVTPSILTTQADLEIMVNGMYGRLNPFPFKQGIYTLVTTDDCHYVSAQTTLEIMVGERSYTPSLARLATFWESLYKVINAANVYMETAEGLSGKVDEAYISRTVGDALFLRATMYFYMVRLFGGVPLLTESFSLESGRYKPRASVDSVYLQIFKDYEDATRRLPLNSSSIARGRATKGAAQGMLAAAYLTYANYLDLNNKANKNDYYQLAKNYADSVIQSGVYSLVDNYADLWDVSKEANNYQKEVIYGIQYTKDPNDNSEGCLGSRFSRDYSPANSGFTATTTGWFRVQPYFIDIYSTGEYVNDYRVETSFATTWKNVNNGNTLVGYPQAVNTGQVAHPAPYLLKFKDPNGMPFNNENDMYILRLSEMYMIYAEAENELNGPTAVAYNAFNKLRERARKANGTARTAPANLTTGLGKEDFRMAVFKERGLEFVGEDRKRFFDLLRMKSPTGDPMYMYQVNVFLPTITTGDPTWNAAQKKWLGGRKNNNPFKLFTEKNLLMPIPQSELNANPNFGNQNPGW